MEEVRASAMIEVDVLFMNFMPSRPEDKTLLTGAIAGTVGVVILEKLRKF